MRSSEATLRVLRALALLGAAGAPAACQRAGGHEPPRPTNNDLRAPETSAIAGTACGAQMPSEGASCEGHTVGHECEWSGFLRCTCTQTDQGPQWKRCMSRAVPGPLPPPELSA